MKSQLCHTLVFLISTLTNGYSQFTTYVDQVPLAKQCKDKDISKALDCTEQLIFDFFTIDVDTLQCRNDTIKSYRANFKVSQSGKASNLTEFKSWPGEDPCFDYFNEKAASLLNSYDWLPASLDGKAIDFKKHIGFSYPVAIDISNLELDKSRVYKIVEQMPRFSGCEEMIGSALDKETCAQTKMLMHIYKSLVYPPLARENNVQGMVVVQFIVNTSGFLQDFDVVRSIGGGCDEAAVNALKSMNDLPFAPFVPGVQRDKAVKVLYTMPIRFKLEANSILPNRKKKNKKNKKDKN